MLFRSAIVSSVLRKNKIRIKEKKTTSPSPNPTAGGLPKSIASRLTYCRLYQASEFIDEMSPIEDIEEMKACVVKHVPGRHVERLARPVVSIPALEAVCYGRTDLDGARFDGMLILQNRFVFLVKYYEDVQRMVSGDELDQIKRCQEIARSRHAAFATVIKDGHIGIKRFIKKQESIRPTVERRFFNAINSPAESDHEVSIVAKRINAGADTVIALGLKHGCSFSKYPFSVWPASRDRSSKESLQDSAAIAGLKEFSFTQKDALTLLSIKELVDKFMDNSSKLYFGTIRVFMTGFVGSFLYKDCKDYELFGCQPKLRLSDLKNTLDSFSSLGLLDVETTRNGKTFYIFNSSLYTNSGIDGSLRSLVKKKK